MIDWSAFLVVAVASLLSSVVVVSLYSLGLRLLTTAGRVPVVEPAEFTGAITVLTPKRAAKEAKRARKAAAGPLSPLQKQVALMGAYACFVLCSAAVLYGVYLIVPALHR
ncbi:peptidase [Cryobacterium sp. TMT1-19]|uniref:peptidase n=1 Tax=unclassified Cryobacterium TaxID=2649013 RepID=UPI000CE40845|nr:MULTISPECIES: peptidase [unclassified Cryobacterium]TFD34828.1 peptidase [Cryobacterium sp. TMT1-19]